jgi:acetyltransferase
MPEVTSNTPENCDPNARWERHFMLAPDLWVLVRPVRAGDDLLIQDLFVHMNRNDLRLRFFRPIKTITPDLMRHLTQFDRSRAMAFIAIDESGEHALGVVRLHGDASRENAEYAIAVRSDLKGHGLGRIMMQLIIEYAKSIGLRRMQGEILQENDAMLTMCKEFGFEITINANDQGIREATLTFGNAAPCSANPA